MSILASFKLKTKTLKLAKMAFIGQETVRKQHNFSLGMYTLIAVFVHFNHFIDVKISFHTNPYNLASSRLLWFWSPCVEPFTFWHFSSLHVKGTFFEEPRGKVLISSWPASKLLAVKVAKHSFGSLWLYVICQIMARERLLLTSWKLASEKCTDERFWLTGKNWRFPSFHGNMNDWIQP